MYVLTKEAKSQFIKLFGYTPSDNDIKKILSQSYCVQYFKIFSKSKTLYHVRPEILFHTATETCFACDRYKKRIYAIYKAEKGIRDV